MTAPAPPPLEMISVDHARVRFGSIVAVRDVSFLLRPGELLGLIGPNGAGKTTLLRAIAGLQPLSSGAVRLMGTTLGPDRGELMSQIGFTPDTPAFYDALNVRDFLRFIAKGYGLGAAEADERIDFWLDKVWLTDKASQKIAGLSRGMRQRVGIARTLLPNPHVVLLDEPAGGIDPAGRVQFRQLLCDLRQQGKALIVSSHILSDMADYCTHVGMMAKGKLIRFGTVNEIARGFHEGAAAGGRRRYKIVLARSAPAARDLLLTVPDLDAVEANHETIQFEYAAGREEAAALLSRLIGLGLPVAAFAPEAHDLEAAYLRAGIAQVD